MPAGGGGRVGVVLCGDFNIAHTENDIKAWKANVNKAGVLPGERQWLTELIESGWVDVVRRLHPDHPGPYSWWSWRGKAFDNDAGWRIDYHLATGHRKSGGVRPAVVRSRAGDRRVLRLDPGYGAGQPSRLVPSSAFGALSMA